MSNVGDTIIDIRFKPESSNDKLLINRQTSIIVQALVRKTTIYPYQTVGHKSQY